MGSTSLTVVVSGVASRAQVFGSFQEYDETGGRGKARAD